MVSGSEEERELWRSRLTDRSHRRCASRPQVNDDLTTNRPHKPLTEPKKRTGGRRNSGDLTIWHHGGGHKRKIRVIDFKRDKTGIPATVATIEYDPNRSARIALLSYADGEKRYISARWA